MRIRKKKHLETRFAAVSDYIIDNSRACKRFAEDKFTHLEIGCGKDRFAVGTAQRNPGAAFVAVELEPNALIIAAEAARDASVRNLRFISAGAELLGYYFPKHSIEQIYLNFSDPWPRNESRRLTHERYLRLYRHLLASDGKLHMKTDNAPLFEWSAEQFERLGWTLRDVTRDLHSTTLDYGVCTEYEERFMSLGTPINALCALPPKSEPIFSLYPAESSGDIALAASLAERIWGEHYTRILGKSHVAYMIRNLQSAEAIRRDIDGGTEYYLCRYDGWPCGYLAVRDDGDSLFISKLYVVRELRGFGLGREMLDACNHMARERGLTALRLSCNRKNAAALSAYATYGFVVTGESTEDIGGGFVNEDYLLELQKPSPN